MAIGARDEQIDVLESRLSSILSQLDIRLSALRDALQGAGGKTLTDVEAAVAALRAGTETLQSVIDAISGLKGASAKDLTTLEADAEAILARLDITLSALRDALKGASGKDFSTLEAAVESVNTKLESRSDWAHGYIVVETAGTPVQGPNQPIAPGKRVVLIYHPDATGRFGIGKSAAAANLSSGTPVILSGVGQALELYVDNLNRIWVDASVSGEKLIWVVEV